MSTTIVLLLAILILVIALLYSTVGHAGASGYLAAMALFGMAPVVMKPTALTLNILVALIGTIRFYRAGFFSWRTFWPFAVASIPMAYVGGSLNLPVPIYKSVVGVVLLYSAGRLFWSAGTADSKETALVPIWIALIIGAAIGLLSGLTGVGGGIFLSPVLLLMGWAKTRETSGVSVTFILVNSIAAMLGNYSSVTYLPSKLIFWAPAALIGGWIGTELGTRLLRVTGIRRFLSVVLILAGLKLLFEAIQLLIGR
ncbi:MAG TPA: sulfite exporter TauE/SafE family protein [Pyrinomonadaceae bacterium]|nr:sulfite exporter TauE/SafE family protein [Pyrinomonadaceae bacterium]